MFNKIAAVTAITIGMTISIFGQNTSLKGEVGKAMGYFQNIGDRDFEDHLRRIRLPEVSAAHKAESLANLSVGTEVRISDRNQLRFNSIRPILRYHQRDSVIEIKVVKLDYALVALQDRAVLIVSDKALKLLSTEELQASAAHEMGHEYFWQVTFNARNRKQYRKLREIELLCDGIAIITLEYLNMDSRSLISAILRMNDFNARILTTDALYHPSIGDRIKYNRAMLSYVKTINASRSALAGK